MGNKIIVLIVDDEPNIRLMFRTALESDGYGVVEASDGTQGLEALRRSPADLVLLDLLMPGLGGMEVLRQLREAGNPVPVVIITAHGRIPDAVAAMQLGAIDFLSKPVTPDVLRQVVAKVVRRHASEHASSSPRPEGGGGADALGEKLRRAERALNRRDFGLAEASLKEALAFDGRSEEAQSLWETLQKCKARLGAGPYPILRELCG